jgi:hypothetical protein
MIRMNMKLSMVLENEAKLNKLKRKELEDILNKYTDLQNESFNSTGDKRAKK